MSPPAALPEPPCRCCGSARVRLRGHRPGRFLAREFSYYECTACCFLFVEPVTDPAIYNDEYYAGRGPDPSVNYQEEYGNYASTPRLLEFADLFRLAAEHRRSATASPRAGPVPAWLDFGCGAGGLLKYLRAQGGFEIAGHDVGSFAERLRQEDGFTVLDSAELEALPERSFDVITCLEVIEHVPEPVPLLALLARLLRPGGLLLLTTGNLHCPMARRQGLDFSYCVPEIHISLFHPELLATLYRQAGLAPVRVRYRGAIRFRILKGFLLTPRSRRWAWLARLPPILWLADFLYGTSAMPCATKPPGTVAS